MMPASNPWGQCPPDVAVLAPYVFTSMQIPASGEGSGDRPVGKREGSPSALSAALYGTVIGQTSDIYDRLDEILRAHGSSARYLLRTNTYMMDLRDFPPMEAVRSRVLQPDPPASSVLQMGSRGVDPAIRLMLDAVALIPGGEVEKEIVRPTGVTSAPAHFSMGVRAGNLIWYSGQVGVNFRTSKIVCSYEDLPDEGKRFASGHFHIDFREGVIAAQAWIIHENLVRMLRQCHLGLANIVRQIVYLRDLRDQPTWERIQNAFFAELPYRPVVTTVEIPRVGRNDDCAVEVDFIASTEREDVISPASLIHAMIEQGPIATRTSGMLFVAGQTGVDAITGVGPNRFADLGLAARHLPRYFAAQPTPAFLQTLEAIRRISEVLDSCGLGLSEVAKLTVFLTDLNASLDVRAALTLALPRAPALSVIPVTRLHPSNEAVLKIDAIARCR